MGKFTFTKSRRKDLAELSIPQPMMSKAHKILGSTPINIDSPRLWDDGSSSFSATTSDSATPSYDDDDIHHVAIAHSDLDWSEDRDILPGLLSDDTRSRQHVHGTLRKSQSSSTIKSWYMNGNPLAQHAPLASAGPPALHTDALGIKSKKKPATLDFSHSLQNSRKGSLPQLRTDGLLSSTSQPNKSPSLFSMRTPTLDKYREPRKIQKRKTKESPQSPYEMQRPSTAGSKAGTTSSREVPDLYDHYEQMTFRSIKQEEYGGSSEDGTQRSGSISTECSSEKTTSRGSPKSFPEPPRAVPNRTSSAFSSSAGPVLMPATLSPNSTTISSPQSQSSKSSPRGFKSVNLQEQSVLMLSDSESEDEYTPPPAPPQPPASSNHQVRGNSRSPTGRGQPTQPREQSSPEQARPNRSNKRTSFAPSNTYITIPNSNDHPDDTTLTPPLDSRSNTPSQMSMHRMSISSDISTNSAYIQEARAVRMQPALRSSRINIPASAIQRQTIDEDGAMGHIYDRDDQSGEQLTPPVSPTSIEFYIRSAHSSIDGPGSATRFIATTRRSELMKPILRYQEKMEEQSPQTQHDASQDDSVLSADGSEANAAEAETQFDFDFPAPPSARQSASGQRTSHRFTLTESVGSVSQRSSQVPLKGILKKSSVSTVDFDPSEELNGHDSDPINYEDDEPSPDMNDFQEFSYLTSGILSPELADDYILPAVAYNPNALFTNGGPPRTTPSNSVPEPPASGPLSRRESSPKAIPVMESVAEVDEGEASSPDIPRPDSPISPDTFTEGEGEGQSRSRLGSIARLSAVGSLPPNEPGWWGEND